MTIGDPVCYLCSKPQTLEPKLRVDRDIVYGNKLEKLGCQKSRKFILMFHMPSVLTSILVYPRVATFI